MAHGQSQPQSQVPIGWTKSGPPSGSRDPQRFAVILAVIFIVVFVVAMILV